MDDIDELFRPPPARESWRERIEANPAAADTIRRLEARIVELQQLPGWTEVARRLATEGFDITPTSLGTYYRAKYPEYRRPNG